MSTIPVLVGSFALSAQPLLNSELAVLLMIKEPRQTNAQRLLLKGAPKIMVAYRFNQVDTRISRNRAPDPFIDLQALEPKLILLLALALSRL
jgi:hypothetical protein